VSAYSNWSLLSESTRATAKIDISPFIIATSPMALESASKSVN
jgi:hypothetical protein